MRTRAMSRTYLNGLELLERLPAARAVADRQARSGAEDVLEKRVRRAAVRALEGAGLQLDELGLAGLARGRWREARTPELLSAFRSNPVGRPRVVENHLDVGLAAERANRLGHLIAHHLERRAPEEGRRELDADPIVLDRDVADDAEVDERDRRDLWVGDLGKGLPDELGSYHVAPGTLRRTTVIFSQSSVSSALCSPRSTGSTSGS